MPERQSRPVGQRRQPPNGNRRPSEAAVATSATRYFVILFQSGADDIERETVRDIQAELDELITTPPNETEIDVWIESFGGDAHAAYKLAVDLRSRSRRLSAVVPDIAKSAATLLALGMDEIFMAAAAELGPLDIQVSHPDKEDITISALDISDAIEFLSEKAFGLVIAGGGSVVAYTGLRRSEVLTATFPFVAQLLEPIVAKLDPHILHQATNQLRVAEKYAKELLSRRAGTDDEDEERSQSIVNHLIHHYPAHEFAIVRREARKMLPVTDIEEYPHLRMMRAIYELFKEEVEDTGSLVVVLNETMLAELETSRTEEEEGENETTNSPEQEETEEETRAVGRSAVSSGRGEAD